MNASAASDTTQQSPADYLDNWIVQVRKGLIELCILNALEAEERYGYDLVRTLVDLPGLGVTEGTIYPLLSRLRAQARGWSCVRPSPLGAGKMKPCSLCLRPEGRVCPAARAR